MDFAERTSFFGAFAGFCALGERAVRSCVVRCSRCFVVELSGSLPWWRSWAARSLYRPTSELEERARAGATVRKAERRPAGREALGPWARAALATRRPGPMAAKALEGSR